ncbi:MAG: hypothetical protein EXX96DRAFT_590632 [Benjaminiella poitrasii]|nr:MAG: hypothetical protein EXX96DRAFT_590632 [Benjaminiella poitrasii]
MRNWTSLSPELLQIIFKNVYASDDDNVGRLSQCQQVCKSWSRPAQIILYEEIRIWREVQRTLFLETITATSSSTAIGRLVKKIVLYNLHTTDLEFQRSMFESLAKSCVNLEELDVREPTVMCWSSLLNGYILGYWKRLFVLPEYKYATNENRHYHESTALVFRNVLQSLMICDKLGSRATKDGEYKFQNNILYRSLHIFTSLRKLIFKITTHQANMHMMDILLDNLPGTIIDMVFEANTADEVAPDIISVDRGALVAAGSPTRLNLSTITPNLYMKRLEIITVINSGVAIEYIMHKFPNLTELYLNTDYNASTFWRMYSIIDLFRLNDDVMKRLISYLLHLEQFSVYLAINNMADFIRLLVAAKKPTNVTYIFNFMGFNKDITDGYGTTAATVIETTTAAGEGGGDAVDEEIEEEEELSEEEELIEETIEPEEMIIEEQQPQPPQPPPDEPIFTKIDLSGKRNIKGAYDLTFEHTICKTKMKDIQTSVNRTLEALGKIVDRLKIEFCGKEMINVPETFDYNTALMRCRQLKRLYIKNAIMSECHQKRITINPSVTHLYLEDCSVVNDAMYQLSLQLPNLRVIEVDLRGLSTKLREGKEREDQICLLVVDVPYTALESFTLLGSSDLLDRGTFSEIYLKIDTTAEIKYYHGDQNLRLHRCAAEDFEYSVRYYNDTCLCFDIRCKKFGRFEMRYQGFNGVCEFDDSRAVMCSTDQSASFI